MKWLGGRSAYSTTLQAVTAWPRSDNPKFKQRIIQVTHAIKKPHTLCKLLIPDQVRNSQGLRGCPSHQGVFPAFTHVKLNLPAPHAVCARLHSITGRHTDADSACFDVLLRDTRNWRDVHLKIQTMLIFNSLDNTWDCIIHTLENMQWEMYYRYWQQCSS